MLRATASEIAILFVIAAMLAAGAVRAADADHVGHPPIKKPPDCTRQTSCAPPYLLNSQPTSGSQQIGIGGETFAYSLQCTTASAESKLSQHAAEASVRLDLGQKLLGYSVTGGSCDFLWQPTIPALIDGVASKDQPVKESKGDGLDGWQCRIGDNSKQTGPEVHKYQATAHLVACKVTISQSAFGSQATWTTPGDGTLVMLMRSAKGFDADAAIPFSVQVCMTGQNSKLPDGTDRQVTAYVWTTAGSDPQGDNEKTAFIPLGKCAQIDQPAAIIVQQGQDEGGIVSGFYELLPAGTFKNRVDVAVGPPFLPGKDAKPTAQLGPQRTMTAQCGKLPTPTIYFQYACKLPLAPVSAGTGGDRKGYRVCIGADYLRQPDGTAPYPAYAVSLLSLVLNADVLGTTPGSPYDYRWNPIFPGGCHDLVFATEAYFVIGSDPSGYWDASKIGTIEASVQEISWN
jgi:hypothetical protein